MKDRLCRVIKQRKQLITIFKFDSEKHRGNFEDAILEALFNGRRSRRITTIESISSLAAKFSEGTHTPIAELKLAMAWQKIDYAQKYILTDRTISKWEVGHGDVLGEIFIAFD